ncbi:hypothetical protein U1Q18_019710 [Sarracenia purpurea var. burkii]
MEISSAQQVVSDSDGNSGEKGFSDSSSGGVAGIKKSTSATLAWDQNRRTVELFLIEISGAQQLICLISDEIWKFTVRAYYREGKNCFLLEYYSVICK